MRQVIDEFVLVPRGEAAERINGTMILSETAAFIYENLIYNIVKSCYQHGNNAWNRKSDQ